MTTEVKKSAGRPSTKVKEEKIDEVIIDTKSEEVKSLKSENSEMAEMLKQLQKQMLEMQNKISTNQPQVFVTNESNSDATRTILITGTLPFTQAVTTEQSGRGRAYILEGLYESKPVPFTDMQKIVINCEEKIKDGRILLSSKKDYEDLQIGYIYDLVPTLDSIKELTELNSIDAVNLIVGLSKEMQEGVISSIANNIVNGKEYDYNIIKMLKNKGIDVDKFVETIKESIEEDLDEE